LCRYNSTFRNIKFCKEELKFEHHHPYANRTYWHNNKNYTFKPKEVHTQYHLNKNKKLKKIKKNKNKNKKKQQ